MQDFLLQQGWNLSNIAVLQDHMEGWTIVTVISGVVSLITLLYLVIAVGCAG